MVGASANPQKLGYRLLHNLIAYDFAGPIFPINPHESAIVGRTAFPSVAAVPDAIDLALISIPSHAVPDAVRDCAKAGVKAAVILSSGFGEAGQKGRGWETEMVDLARGAGMRLVGPNCMGVYSIHDRCNGTYFWDLPRTVGGISFVSQSGAYGGIFFEAVKQQGMGIAKFLSIGNQIDVGFPEVVDYLGEDPHTSVITLFIEEVKRGEEFLQVARRVSRHKPIVVFKAGRTEAGRRAARSHTGSMAGEMRVFDAAMRQAGVVVARESEEFFDVARVLSCWGDRPPRDGRLAIVTISGGPCVIASDCCEERGLHLPPLAAGTVERVRTLIPSFGASSNPVDMTPQMEPSHYLPCVTAILEAEEVSGAIAINVGLDLPQFGEAVAQASQHSGKPVVAFTVSTPAVNRILDQHRIPILPGPERAAKAYAGLVEYGRSRSRSVSSLPPAGVRSSARLQGWLRQGRHLLNEHEAKQILEEYGIGICAERLVLGLDEVLHGAGELGYPLVVKALPPGLTHKSEAGAVRLGIGGQRELEVVCEELWSRFGQDTPLLLQEMVSPGIELMVGGKRDPTFGSLIACGLGGVWTELYQDFALRLLPIDRPEALSMLLDLRGAAILQGYRGNPGGDEDAIATLLLQVGELLLGNPQIAELDINPVVVTGQRLVVVDALIVLSTL